MGGHLEPLAAVLRIGGAYGEPYTWAATVRYLSPSVVEIIGAIRAPSPSEWRAAVRVLRASGITRFSFDRRRATGVQTRRHQTR